MQLLSVYRTFAREHNTFIYWSMTFLMLGLIGFIMANIGQTIPEVSVPLLFGVVWFLSMMAIYSVVWYNSEFEYRDIVLGVLATTTTSLALRFLGFRIAYLTSADQALSITAVAEPLVTIVCITVLYMTRRKEFSVG